MRKSVCKFMDYLCRGKGRREKMDKCRTREVKGFASEGEDERMSGVFDFSLPLQFFCSHLILSSLQFHYPALFLNATLPLSLPVCLPFLPYSALRISSLVSYSVPIPLFNSSSYFFASSECSFCTFSRLDTTSVISIG